MRYPINLAGGEYVHKSRPLSAQRTRNFWPQLQPNPKEKSKYILQSFYGLKTFATTTDAVGRGLFENQGTLYRVADKKFYSVASDGTHTLLGTFPVSSLTGSRCIFDAIDADITIVIDNKAFQWNGSTLTQITDPNMASPNSCASLNSQMLYDEGSGQVFWVSDVGDATTLNGLNYASAESSPDELKRVAVFKQTAYMMGGKTIELWWDSGQGNPPLDRLQGGIINNGLDAIHSVASNDDFLFYFGNDKQVHSLTGGSSSVDTVVSTPALAREFAGYSTTSDGLGWCMQLEGQWFYVITFPTENITHVYPVGGEWFQWGTGITGRIRANDYAYVYNKHIVEDYASGNLYELDAETYTDNSETIIRTRDTASIHGGLIGADGKRIEMNYFEILMETGVGLLSGQGSDPEVMLSWSDDGGKTFSNERRGKIGREGRYVKIMWNALGSFYERILRISISDPVYCSIHSAVADLEAGI